MRLSDINDFFNNRLEWLSIDYADVLNEYSYGQNWDDIAFEDLKKLEITLRVGGPYTIDAPKTDLFSFTWRQLLNAIERELAYAEHYMVFEGFENKGGGLYELILGT
jgi:hypothetical protein